MRPEEQAARLSEHLKRNLTFASLRVELRAEGRHALETALSCWRVFARERQRSDWLAHNAGMSWQLRILDSALVRWHARARLRYRQHTPRALALFAVLIRTRVSLALAHFCAAAHLCSAQRWLSLASSTLARGHGLRRWRSRTALLRVEGDLHVDSARRGDRRRCRACLWTLRSLASLQDAWRLARRTAIKASALRWLRRWRAAVTTQLQLEQTAVGVGTAMLRWRRRTSLQAWRLAAIVVAHDADAATRADTTAMLARLRRSHAAWRTTCGAASALRAAVLGSSTVAKRANERTLRAAAARWVAETRRRVALASATAGTRHRSVARRLSTWTSEAAAFRVNQGRAWLCGRRRRERLLRRGLVAWLTVARRPRLVARLARLLLRDSCLAWRSWADEERGSQLHVRRARYHAQWRGKRRAVREWRTRSGEHAATNRALLRLGRRAVNVRVPRLQARGWRRWLRLLSAAQRSRQDTRRSNALAYLHRIGGAWAAWCGLAFRHAALSGDASEGAPIPRERRPFPQELCDRLPLPSTTAPPAQGDAPSARDERGEGFAPGATNASGPASAQLAPDLLLDRLVVLQQLVLPRPCAPPCARAQMFASL